MAPAGLLALYKVAHQRRAVCFVELPFYSFQNISEHLLDMCEAWPLTNNKQAIGMATGRALGWSQIYTSDISEL